jgi:hypothetical protein
MATGSIERLPSGKHHATVYAGIDPLTKTHIYLKGPARPNHDEDALALDPRRTDQ